MAAASALGNLGAPGVPRLIALVKDRNRGLRVRMAAVRALGHVGPEAHAALDVLKDPAITAGLWTPGLRAAIAAIEGAEAAPSPRSSPSPPS